MNEPSGILGGLPDEDFPIDDDSAMLGPEADFALPDDLAEFPEGFEQSSLIDLGSGLDDTEADSSMFVADESSVETPTRLPSDIVDTPSGLDQPADLSAEPPPPPPLPPPEASPAPPLNPAEESDTYILGDENASEVEDQGIPSALEEGPLPTGMDEAPAPRLEETFILQFDDTGAEGGDILDELVLLDDIGEGVGGIEADSSELQPGEVATWASAIGEQPPELAPTEADPPATAALDETAVSGIEGPIPGQASTEQAVSDMFGGDSGFGSAGAESSDEALSTGVPESIADSSETAEMPVPSWLQDEMNGAPPGELAHPSEPSADTWSAAEGAETVPAALPDWESDEEYGDQVAEDQEAVLAGEGHEAFDQRPSSSGIPRWAVAAAVVLAAGLIGSVFWMNGSAPDGAGVIPDPTTTVAERPPVVVDPIPTTTDPTATDPITDPIPDPITPENSGGATEVDPSNDPGGLSTVEPIPEVDLTQVPVTMPQFEEVFPTQPGISEDGADSLVNSRPRRVIVTPPPVQPDAALPDLRGFALSRDSEWQALLGRGETIVELENGHSFRGRVKRFRDGLLTIGDKTSEYTFPLSEVRLMDINSPDYRPHEELPEASVVLMNGQRIRARLIKETDEHIVLSYETGRLLVSRDNVREVSFRGRVHF